MPPSQMHPDRRVWAQISNDGTDSSGTSSSGSDDSEDSSSDDEPPAKTRARRSNELVCTTIETDENATDGFRSEPFYSMMKESFNNAVLSDVTVCIRTLRVPAHSFVLAAQCSYFKNTLTKGGLKNESVKEFRYDGDQPHAYWRMLEYLYKGDYGIIPAAEINEPDDQLICRHIHVYVIAEALEIDGLQRLATERFKRCVKEDQLDKTFVTCIKLVFKHTKVRDNMLRKEVMSIVSRHPKALWEIDTFRGLVHLGQDFTVDFVAGLLEDK
ncbi:hypothetical protein V2A60_007081 [Cordyceps javanica]|uniref:BTB/POZ fold domain-containing protein n=1 Tax=Cordyceps javanica TaxID=43265 RepID=A0A545USE3_9HYPO|nr:BTB/POZ fold domain-containing protein [Cordyceps javanica]TQW04367.1 BTB/POZ fold domain containing protein [Cordyceps javanica]